MDPSTWAYTRSLSSWLRDYLYIALGGNRNGAWKTYRNLFLTMAIAGLWHGGDSWNYLLWGAAHGIALCVDRLWSRSRFAWCSPLVCWLRCRPSLQP